ncbi:MAG: ABC transporter ATP-binding protein [candidate division WOR-3 bacterium]
MTGKDRKAESKTHTARSSESLRIVAEFWRTRKSWAVLLVLGMLASTALTLAFPHLLRLIIDGISSGITRQRLIGYVVVLGGIGTLRVLGEVLMPFARGRINEIYAWKVRSEVFRRLLDMGHTFSARYPTGDVMERLDHDMMELSFFACSVIFRFIGSLFMLAFALVIMIRMNPLLTLISVLPVSLAVVGWMRMGPKMFALFMKWRQKISEVNSQIEAVFSGIRLVKAYCMEARLARRFEQTLSERVTVAVDEARVEAQVELFYLAVAETATLLVLWVGGTHVVTGRLSLGGFVAFNAYILMLLTPMFDIGRLVVSGRRAQGTAERIDSLRRHAPEVICRPNPQLPVPGVIRFERVTFSYGDRPALKDINLTFAPGQKVGIAGTIGSGKSTLFRLLFRLADPQQGRITLSGTDIRDLDLDRYRQLFGYAPQEPTLFSDTVGNNILFGRKVDPHRLRQVIAAAELDPDIAGFARGLDEKIGERGTRLSGGQKQRVAIARALVNSPPVLVFDDATSALDARTEQELIRRLVTGLGQTTAIIVSHRLSVLAACDWVYVLDAGELKEQGTHDELLARRGLYWQLYQRQLAREELEQL